mgnify:FL=1
MTVLHFIELERHHAMQPRSTLLKCSAMLWDAACESLACAFICYLPNIMLNNIKIHFLTGIHMIKVISDKLIIPQDIDHELSKLMNTNKLI